MVRDNRGYLCTVELDGANLCELLHRCSVLLGTVRERIHRGARICIPAVLLVAPGNDAVQLRPRHQLANLVAIDELRVYSEALLKLHDVLDGGPVLFPSEDHVSHLLEPARISELFIEALEHLDSPF